MTATKDVQIERTFNAPIDLIWAMCTEPEHFANWYGPIGAKIPKAEMDVRVGGRRHIAMAMDTPRGPMEMFFVGEYCEVDPKTRLVYTEAMADADGNALKAEQTGMPPGAHRDVDRGRTRRPRRPHQNGYDAHRRTRRLARRPSLGDGNRKAGSASRRPQPMTSVARTPSPAETLFWDLIDELREHDDRVEEGTIMGGRCARVSASSSDLSTTGAPEWSSNFLVTESTNSSAWASASCSSLQRPRRSASPQNNLPGPA